MTSKGIKKRSDMVLKKREAMRDRYHQDKEIVSAAETTQETEEETPQSKSKSKSKSKVKAKDTKALYGDFVKLTEEEYQKLVEQFGRDGADRRIEKLNLYKGSTGKKYKSDYLTILSWERRDHETRKDNKLINGHPF